MGRHKRQQQRNFPSSFPVAKGLSTSPRAIDELPWNSHRCYQSLKAHSKTQTVKNWFPALVKVGLECDQLKDGVLPVMWRCSCSQMCDKWPRTLAGGCIFMYWPWEEIINFVSLFVILFWRSFAVFTDDAEQYKVVGFWTWLVFFFLFFLSFLLWLLRLALE